MTTLSEQTKHWLTVNHYKFYCKGYSNMYSVRESVFKQLVEFNLIQARNIQSYTTKIRTYVDCEYMVTDIGRLHVKLNDL